MGLSMADCAKLKAAGYTEHDIAQVAKVPTPTIVKLVRFGMQPQQPIEIDVEALIEAKKGKFVLVEKPKEEAKATEIVEEKRPVGRPPKTQEIT